MQAFYYRPRNKKNYTFAYGNLLICLISSPTCHKTLMKKLRIIILFCFTIAYSMFLYSQNYTSYFTGNPVNIVTSPVGGICMMGGSVEDDNAMRWFLQRANGGDILVLRASGSNGYNNYMYSELGVNVNSVETIVCHNALASYDPYVQSKIQQAEAIWFAGGNQWNYVSYWRNTPVAALINEAMQNRNIVIGGTSAGMAILGGYYYTAQNGSVTSAQALSNPYHSLVTVDNAAFLQIPIISNVITDTHFDNPNRKGRTVTFLARTVKNQSFPLKAIACNERAAVCIDTNGIASVYGTAAQHQAFFIQPNCGLENVMPETCLPSTPLSWNHSGQSVKVYKVTGNLTGSNTFNLKTWLSGSGGTWENWSALNGVLNEFSGLPIQCACGNCTCLQTRFIHNTGNDGPGSLRAALECVPQNGIIQYSAPFLSSQITQPLDLRKNVEIKGENLQNPGLIQIQLNNTNSSPAVNISGENLTVTLENIQIINTGNPLNVPVTAVQDGVQLQIRQGVTVKD